MPLLQDILSKPGLNGVYRLGTSAGSGAFALVPVLDGRTLKHKQPLLVALGHALDLPDYYGANWDALEECLGDFSWREGPIRLLIHHADALPCDLVDLLVDVFSEAAAGWANRGRPCSLFLADTARADLPEVE